jgi:hypothetical protein
MLYPHANLANLIAPGSNDPVINPRIIVIHTMDGTMEGSNARFHDGSGIEAHFGVAIDGRVWQWRDTHFEADAQSAGNPYCISIETEDNGNPETRWGSVQFNELMDLMNWISLAHKIPFRLVGSTQETGIGYHRQFVEWNPNNHSCPGTTRRGQLINELIPALREMGAIMEDATKIVRQILVGDETKEANRAVNNVQNLRLKVDAIQVDVDTIKSDISAVKDKLGI